MVNKANKKGFTPPEVVIGLLLISVFIYFLYNQYKKIEIQGKAVVAEIDVKNLNLAVKIFKIKYGRYPRNLYELKEKNCLIVKSTPIITKKSIFKDKKLYDPFGNPYIYDNTTGRVTLSKKSISLIKKY